MALASLGLLIIGAIPTVIGVAEAIDAQKKQNQQAKERIKFNLTVTYSPDGKSPPQIAFVFLRNGKLWLDHPQYPLPTGGYKFNGFYFEYPDQEKYQGLVTMASDDPPAMHWIYIHKETGEVRHGKRSDTMADGPHKAGPFGWTEDEEFIALESTPAFLAVLEEDEGEKGAWALYFDKDNEREALDDRAVVDVFLHRELQLGVSSKLVGSNEKR